MFSGRRCIACKLHYTGWTKKSGLFLKVDNYAMVSGRNACGMSTVCKFRVEKEYITCVSERLNILCQICINIHCPWNYAEVDLTIILNYSIFTQNIVKQEHSFTQTVETKFNIWASLTLITIISLLAADRSLGHACVRFHANCKCYCDRRHLRYSQKWKLDETLRDFGFSLWPKFCSK